MPPPSHSFLAGGTRDIWGRLVCAQGYRNHMKAETQRAGTLLVRRGAPQLLIAGLRGPAAHTQAAAAVCPGMSSAQGFQEYRRVPTRLLLCRRSVRSALGWQRKSRP